MGGGEGTKMSLKLVLKSWHLCEKGNIRVPRTTRRAPRTAYRTPRTAHRVPRTAHRLKGRANRRCLTIVYLRRLVNVEIATANETKTR